MRKNNLYFVFIIWIYCSLFVISVGCANELRPLYPDYPTQFDIRGHVDSIGDEEVIINDTVYKFSPEIIFIGPHGKISYSSLVGADVGGVVDKSGLLESLWLINKNKRGSSAVLEEKVSRSQQRKKVKEHRMIKKNGVWMNVE